MLVTQNFFPVPKPFGDQKLNMVKFCGLQHCTAKFLALSQPNSETLLWWDYLEGGAKYFGRLFGFCRVT